ncbi:aminoglycoside phosphotransferase family protein [Brachybacterium sp. YJGR34]|uniref:aminoglycoside phosphotransferase family protein n=1 Tax=Brachybacterium sp. YJGR34 TaxID=2059911 RepID=UPI000E09E13E|nr:aminoglycoside phosphotransferase family protein [Brachybacterium sp. YJGR34]
MDRPLPIDLRFRRRLLHQDSRTGPWLEAASDRAAEVCREWGLATDGAPRFGGTSIVLPVRTADGEAAALKLVSPIADVSHEITALRLLAGHGVLTLLRADADRRVLLLERLDGPALSQVEDPRQAARIAGGVAREIAGVPAPADAPRLAETSRSWTEAFQAQHGRAVAAGLRIPERAGEIAAEIIEDLAEDTSRTLTHGDLSLENVLRRADGSWAAIDPGLLCGPVEYEAHTVVRSVLPVALAAEDPRAELRAVVTSFCEAAGADLEVAERISFARLVSSYYWESQHAGDAFDVDRLRRTVELLADG